MCIRYFCFHLCLIFWCPFFLCVSESTCIISADFTNILITYAPSHTKLALNYVLPEFTWQIKGRTFLVSWMRKWVQLKHCEGWPSAKRDSVCFLWESEKQCSVHGPIRALASFMQGTKEGLPSIPQFFGQRFYLLIWHKWKKNWYKKNCMFEGTCEQMYRNNSLMIQLLLRSLSQNPELPSRGHYFFWVCVIFYIHFHLCVSMRQNYCSE